MIFHLLTPEAWSLAEASGTLAVPGADGFVHCCDAHQVDGVRIRFFSGRPVVVVELDPTRLRVETRYEPGADLEGERFAHVHGVVPVDAAVSARVLI